LPGAGRFENELPINGMVPGVIKGIAHRGVISRILEISDGRSRR
jgi:hypothetical protein